MDLLGRTALVHCANFGHGQVVKILCREDADVNLADPTNKCAPITAAAYSGHGEIVQQVAPERVPYCANYQSWQLIDCAANIDTQTMRGATALLLSSQVSFASSPNPLL